MAFGDHSRFQNKIDEQGSLTGGGGGASSSVLLG
jgi:hypothetical protein